MSTYYYTNSANETPGPFDLAEVWLLIDNAVIGPETLVSTGSDAWFPLREFPELACHAAEHGVAQRRSEGEMIAVVILTLLFPVFGVFAGVIDVCKPPPRRSQGGVLIATAIFSIVVASLLFGWWRAGGSSVAASALLTHGPRWEYKIVAPSDEEFDAEMASYGHEGWEIVSARRASSGSAHVMSYEVILKRPK